jgi:ribose 1,5-bisphosphate isomerase
MASIDERIGRVRNDKEHGSRWLVRETITLLRDLASDTSLEPDERAKQLQSAGQALLVARPAMAAIAGVTLRILGAPGGVDSMAQAARQLLKDYDTATARITDHARPLLVGTLMTHSLSGTVLDVLTACASQLDGVIVLEGRPRYEGRDTARALSKVGIAVTLITDAQAAIFLPQCHAVVTGADSILADGGILNKAGTALLGWAARGEQKPFYVLCETLKVSPRRWQGNLSRLEEKEAEEVLETSIEGVTARNFYFDYTPARLLTHIITEQGITTQRDIRHISSMLQRTSKALDLRTSS